MERANIDWKNLPFNYYKTDCHLEYYFRNGKWDTGEIITDDILKLPISSTCLHYGQEAFEGIKVFEQKDGKISVFRVEENAKTFNVSFKEELHRVIIHGVLHYMGYKDKTDEEKQLMRDRENSCLKTVNL